MKIQSLSVVVPNKKCINDCAFCVSKMHNEDYPNMMDDNKPFYDLYLKDYLKRLEFARDNGCNTVMLTGTSEPQQNKDFLTHFGLFMMLMQRPFRIIEMQTTGVLLDESYLRFLRNHVGVNTISLSASSLDSMKNCIYNRSLTQIRTEIDELCSKIKKYDFTLRLSLNMTDQFDGYTAKELFDHCRRLGADQVTLRVLYASGNDTVQDRWIKEHSVSEAKLEEFRNYVVTAGKEMEILEYGATRYSVGGISVVVDDDCMSKIAKKEVKYLILRPDCKLYSKWDDKASLVF